MRPGPTELIIILVIVIVIFGPSRLGNVMGELGKGIRSFKDNIKRDDPAEMPADKTEDKKE